MKKSVLIVEDDRWQAEIYRDVLQKEFDVRLCYGAQEAIEAVDRKTPNLIVLDMMMPGGNGAAFLQELRTYEDVLNIPVVVCSSLRLSHEQHQALAQFAPLTLVDKANVTPQKLLEIIGESLHARAK